ncbi:MAG: hypothetical protein LBF92_08930 [Synergistaceae bacterium]|jgi:Tfp pilus assembly protein PilV|nr:hypothetical protein [Synergistaceae bacterium]
MMISMLGKRRRGASLAEMVVALYVLAIVLLGMMAGIVITQGTLVYKERERATEIALRTLERYEAMPFASLPTSDVPLKEGLYDVTVKRPVFNDSLSAASADLADFADIEVEVEWNKGVFGTRRITMSRQVSASGWQSVGE